LLSIKKIVSVSILSWFFTFAVAPGGPVDIARNLPPDCLGFISIDNAEDLRDHFQKTSVYALYKDPAMQPFLGPAKVKLEKKLAALFKDLDMELGLENMTESWPWPQGQMAGAYFIQPRVDSQPDGVGPGMDSETGQGSYLDFQAIFWADMGKNKEEAQELLRTLTSKRLEDGAVRQKESVRGVEITFLKEDQKSDVNFDSVGFGFYNDRLLIGTSLKYFNEVLKRMRDGDSASLASDRDLKIISKRLGESDLFGYLNIKALLSISLDMVEAAEKEEAQKMMALYGVEGLTGLGVAMQLAPNQETESVGRVLLGCRGEKKGLVAMLCPLDKNLVMSRLVAKGLTSFVAVNYDLSSIYGQAMRMIQQSGGINPEMLIQASMGMTGDPGEGGRPPVNLRNDVIGQVSDPLVVTTRIKKPFDQPGSTSSLLAVGVRDSQVLDDALGRIHHTFLSQDDPESKRELHDSTIYLIPGSGEFVRAMLNPQGLGTGGAAMSLAFSVVRDQLILGMEEDVEQAIRNFQSDNFESLETDTMFQRVARHLPSRAGLFYYENSRDQTEQTWWTLKKIAREKPATDEEITLQLGVGMGATSGMSSSQLLFLQGLTGYIDFSALPEYEAVKEYFGAAVGYVKSVDEGIYAEFKTVKAPD
jgi:hypothetical protein